MEKKLTKRIPFDDRDFIYLKTIFILFNLRVIILDKKIFNI